MVSRTVRQWVNTRGPAIIGTIALGLTAVATGQAASAAAQPIPASASQSLVASPPDLAPTPPMGFNDWLNFGCNVNEKLMTGVADAFVATGLKSAGYTYVNIDDCWAAEVRAADGSLQADPVKFPHGMKWLADYVHAAGLKFGIYSAASPTTCAGYPGSDGHYAQDMQTFASWGVDYVKLDMCGGAANTLIQQNCDNTTASREFEQRYAQARDAIDVSGRPMILAVSAPASIAYWCGYDNVSYRDAMSWAPKYGELWRTSVDAGQNWASILSTYSQNVTLAAYQSRDHWNDADMLVAGSSNVSPIEQQTQFTLWSEMAAPLLISTNLDTISPTALSILSNKDVIAVDQDPLAEQGTVVASGNGYDVLSKPLAGGDRAVVLFNKSDTAQTISTSTATAGFTRPGAYFLTDLVSKQHTNTAGVIEANVPAHGTVIYRVSRHANPPAGPSGPATALRLSNPSFQPGTPTATAVTFANDGMTPATDVDLTLDVPTGWAVTPSVQHIARVEGGATATVTFDVTAPDLRPGRNVSTLTASAAYDYPGGHATITGVDTVITDVPYASLAQAFNNVGITDDTNPKPGNFDGSGDSYSATALAAAGLTPGSTFTSAGVNFTWPSVPAGTPDNVAGGAPTIAMHGTGNMLGFLGAGIGTPSDTGTITYTDSSTQTYTLTFPNWADSSAGDSVIASRYRNTPNGPANFGYYYRIFEASVALQPGKQIATVTLPQSNALHVFAMAVG